MSLLAAEPGRQYLREVIRDVEARHAAAAPQVAAWLRHCENRDLQPATVLAYEKRTRRLLTMFPHTPFSEFTHLELDAVIADTPSLSKRATVTALNSLFRWGKKRRLIVENPAEFLDEVRQPKQKYAETFSEAEVEALLGLPGEDGFRMLLMLDTGLRIGECCNLQVRDVQETRGQLVVLDGKGGKDRVVPLTGRLVQAYSEWKLLEAPKLTDFVFSHRKPGGHEGTLHRRDPLSVDGLRKWFYRALEDAGVRRLKPHTTRHTYATTMLRRGASITKVSKLLGHSSVATTSAAYEHLVVEDLRDVVALLEV